MKLKRIIVARHAAYTGEHPNIVLNETGRTQSWELAQKLAKIAAGTVCLISSSAPRALQTAEIVGVALGVPTPAAEEALWEDSYHPGLPIASLAPFLLKRYAGGIETADTLVIIGHKDHGGPLADYLATEIVGTEVKSNCPELWYAQACMLELGTRTTTLIK